MITDITAKLVIIKQNNLITIAPRHAYLTQIRKIFLYAAETLLHTARENVTFL
jgi:hypothetical protein